MIKLHVKELEILNNENGILKKDEEPNHKELFYKLIKEIKKFLIYLKIENQI